MSQYATKKDVQEIVDKAVTDLAAVMSGFADSVDKRFDAVDIRFSRIEARLDAHEEEFRKMNAKYDHLINTIDSFIARIDRYETELAARDNQFNKLLEWARKVSEKTGIPLENL